MTEAKPQAEAKPAAEKAQAPTASASGLVLQTVLRARRRRSAAAGLAPAGRDGPSAAGLAARL